MYPRLKRKPQVYVLPCEVTYAYYILSDSVKGTSYVFVSMRKLGKLEKLCCSLALVALISLCPNWFQSWKTNSPEYFCSPPPPLQWTASANCISL